MMMTSDDDTAPFFPSKGSAATQEQKQRNSNSSYFGILSNLPFLYFIIGTILSIACCVLYIMDNSIGYIVSGIIGLIICTFGIKHFRTLISLKYEVDKFYKLNIKFKKEHNFIRRSVDRLSAANGTLKETHDRLYIANEKNRENLNYFQELQYNMEQFNASSLSELQTVMSHSRIIENKWREELFQHERNMLHTVFTRFCSYQNHVGLTKKEFDEFSLQLPIEYQDRFGRMGTFAKMAGNKDVILIEDFEAALDIFAEMHATDCDIEFEIKSTKQKRREKPSKVLKKKKTQYFNQRHKSTILKYINQKELGIDLIGGGDISDDDRKYDDDLLNYQSEIIITRRTRSKSTFKTFGDDIFFENIDNDNKSRRLTPTTPATPATPIGAGQRQLYRRSNVLQLGRSSNVTIRDISSLYRNDNDSSFPEGPPNIESMTTQSIDAGNFTNQQMNQYMSGYNTIPDNPPNIEAMTTQSIDAGNFTNKQMNQYMMQRMNKQSKYKK